MKLRLPHRLQAALVAALASVSFTTLSSGSLSAAFFFGSQAFAEEAADNPGATIDIGDTNLDPQAAIDEEEGKGEAKEPGSAPINQAGFNGIRGSSDDADRAVATEVIAESSIDTENVGTSGQANYTGTSADLPSNDLGFTSNPYASGSDTSNGSDVDSPVTSFTQAPQIASAGGYSAAGTGSGSSTNKTTTGAIGSIGGTGSGAIGGSVARPMALTAPNLLSPVSSLSVDGGSSDSNLSPTPNLGAVTYKPVTITSLSSWNGYNASTGTAKVGHDDSGTYYGGQNNSGQAFNSQWSYVVTLDVSSLTTSTTYNLGTIYLTQNGNSGYGETATLTTASSMSQAATVNFGAWGSTNNTGTINLSEAKTLTFVFSHDNSANNATYFDVYLDDNFTDKVYTKTVESIGFGNTTVQARYGALNGWNYFNHSANKVRMTADTNVGTYTVSSAGYTTEGLPSDDQLLAYYNSTHGDGLVWAGNSTSHTWTNNSSTPWTGGTFTNGSNVVFNATAANKEVLVQSAIAAGTMNVSDAYTFKANSSGSLTAGALNLANNSAVTLWAEATGRIFSLGDVSVDGAASIMNRWNHATQNIDSIQGDSDATLTLISNHCNDTGTWNIGKTNGSAHAYSGKLVLQVQDTDGYNRRTVDFNIQDGGMFSGATLETKTGQLKSGSSADVKLMTNNINLGAIEVKFGGINDGVNDSSAASRQVKWTIKPTSGTSTLTLDGAGTYSTSAAVGANVNINKTGSGTQTFTGNMDAFNGSISVSGGTLALDSAISSASTVNVTNGAILNLGNSLTTTRDVTISSGSTLKLASGNLLTSGGDLTLTGSTLDLRGMTFTTGQAVTLATSNTGTINYSGVDVTLSPRYSSDSYTLTQSGNNLTFTYTGPEPTENTLHIYILTGQSNSLGAVKGDPASSAMLAEYAPQTTQMWDGNMTGSVVDQSADTKNKAWSDEGKHWFVVQRQQAPTGKGNPGPTETPYADMTGMADLVSGWGASTVMGPEYGFSYMMEKQGWNIADGRSDIAIVKVSRDGGNNTQWDPNVGGLTSQILDSVIKAIQNADTEGYTNVSLDGLMFLQGETGNATLGANVKNVLDRLVSYLNTNLTAEMQPGGRLAGVSDKLTVSIGDTVILGEPAGTGDCSNASSTVYKQWAESDPTHAGLVYSHDLSLINPGDGLNLHYDGNSQITIGARYAYAMAQVQGLDTTQDGTVRVRSQAYGDSMLGESTVSLNDAAAWWKSTGDTSQFVDISSLANTVAVWDVSSANMAKFSGEQITADLALGGIRIEDPYSDDENPGDHKATISINNASGTHTLSVGAAGITLQQGNLTVNTNLTATDSQTWNTAAGQQNTLNLTGTTTIADGATVTIEGASIVNISTLAGTGGLTVNGAGAVVTLTDKTAFSGATTVTSGILKNAGTDDLDITGNLTINGNAASFAGNITADTVTLSNIASGQGSFPTYSGTITGKDSITLDNYTVADMNASLVTQKLVAKGGTRTTISNLTLTACEVTVETGSNVTLADSLTLGNTATYSGDLILADNLTIDVTGVDQGDYTAPVALFSTTDGSISVNNLNSIALTGVGASNYYLSLDSGNSNLYLNFGDGPVTTLIWDQTKNTNWSTDTADLNWHADGVSSGTAYFSQNDNVTFESGETNTPVLRSDITAGTVTIENDATVTINGNGYTLATDSIDAARASLALNGGTVSVAQDSTVGSLSGSAALQIAKNATLTVGGTADSTYSGVISGEGGLTKTGNGTLMLNGSNTLSGDITVSGGTLKLGNKDALGSASSVSVATGGTLDINGAKDEATVLDLTLAGGKLVNSGGAASYGSKNLFKSIELTADSEVNASGNEFGLVNGEYKSTQLDLRTNTLTKTGTGTFNLINTTVTGAGFLKAQEGILYFNRAQGDSSKWGSFESNLEMAGGAVMGDIKYGAAGTIKTTADSTLEAKLHTNSSPLTFDGPRNLTVSGVISDAGSIIKTGTGIVTLSGNNTYAGGTTVNAGTLVAGNANALGTGSVTVNEDGTLEAAGNLTIVGTLSGAGNITYTGDNAGTVTLNAQNGGAAGYTGTFTNTGAGDVTLSIPNTSKNGQSYVKFDIARAQDAGKVNLAVSQTSGSSAAADLNLYGTAEVNDITHFASVSTLLHDNADVTATGTVLTGRLALVDKTTEFTLSGENAQLKNGSAGHTYSAKVEGSGTFTVADGATQSLTGDLASFTGTFQATGLDSVLTLGKALNSGADLSAAGGGKISLTSSVTDADAVNIGSTSTLALARQGEQALSVNNLTLASGSILDLSQLSISGRETSPITLVKGGEIDDAHLSSVHVVFAEGVTPSEGYTLSKDANNNLVLTFAQSIDALIWDNNTTNQKWSTSQEDRNWHNAGKEHGSAYFTTNANVAFVNGTSTAQLQEAITAGTMTLEDGANLTVNTKENTLTVTDLDTLGTPSLTKTGTGSATFGGSDEEGVTLSGLNVKVGSAEFAEKVTVDGTKRVYVADKGTTASAEFKGGLEYNGSDTYALAVYEGEGNQATLYGESDLGGKQIGIGKNAKLIIAENASVTSGGVKNSGTFENNGAVVLQDNATLTQQSGQFVTTDLTLGKGAVVNLNADNRDATVATIGSISGEGEIHISSQVRNRTYNIQGNIEDWTGAITQDSSAGSMTLNISGTDVVNADITNSAKTNPASILTLNLKDDMTVNGKVTYTAVAPIDMNVGNSGTAADVTFTNEVKVRNLNVANAGSSATFEGPTQINGTISGNGEMTVNSGSNTVTVEGANNLKGDTTVTAGTLQLNGGGSMGDVIVNGGKFNTTGAQAITLNSLSVTDGIAHVGNSGNVNLGTVSLTGGDLVLNTTVSAGSLTTTSGATLTFAGENMLTTTGNIDLSGGLQLDLSKITYRTDTSAVQTITLATTSGAITLDETQKTYTFLNTKTDVNKTSFTLRDDGANHLVLDVVYNDVTDWPDTTKVSYTYTPQGGTEQVSYDIKVGNTDPHGYNFSQTDDGVVEFNPNLFNNATHTYTDGHDIVMHSNTTIVVEEGNTVKLTGELSSENYSGGGISGTLIKDGAGTLEMAINDKETGPDDYRRNTFEGSVEVSEGTLHVLHGKNGSELAAGDGAHVRVSKGATLDLEAGVSIGIPMGHRTKPEAGDSRAVVISAAGTPAIVQNAYISQDGVRPDDAQDGGRASLDNIYEFHIGNLQDMTQAVTIELSDIVASSVFLEGNVTIDNSHIQSSGDMRIYNDVNAPNTIRNNSIVELTGFWGLINNTDVDKTSKINFLPETEEYWGATLVGQNKVEVGSTENGGVATRTVSDTEITYLSDQYKGLVLGSDDYKSDLSLGITLSDVDLPDDLSGYKFTLTFEDFNTSYVFGETSEFIPLEDSALNVSLFIPEYSGGQWEELVASVQAKYDTATGNTVFMFEHIMTPEPTTGTLSLLALAALAARRRRK